MEQRVTKDYRFGDYVREMTICQKKLSYDLLIPDVETNDDGVIIPKPPAKIKFTFRNLLKALENYVGSRFKDQFNTVIPLAVYLILFQTILLRQNVSDMGSICMGLLFVVLGLMIFMEGLKLGLMPFGEMLGDKLPKRSSLSFVMLIAFLLGFGVTLAEPAIGALKTAGSNVVVAKAPYLYALLNFYPDKLISIVGLGVGSALVLGTLRFLYGWSLKPYIYLTLSIALSLTIIVALNPELATILGLAWDCGAVTTGPVTVPLVLSMGIGVSSAAGKNNSSLSGFGIVTLASLFPIIGVLLLGLYLVSVSSAVDIIAQASQITTQLHDSVWYQQSPYQEIIAGIRAIVPLIGFLLLVLTVILREKIPDKKTITYGLILTIVGIIVFSIGLSNGLTQLGKQSGGIIPAAFMSVANIQDSPIYVYSVGLGIALAFAFCLGFGATLAEPALNALGLTVESLSNGVFKKNLLMYAVAGGVAGGIALGIVKIVFSVPLHFILLPSYVLAIGLSYLSSEEYVNVAWDSAGVTTGPVTVPLVLSMGLGFGNAIGAIEGFGVLALASIGPILSVLITGLYLTWKNAKLPS
jgi:Protein of unknown function (DUF1538)